MEMGRGCEWVGRAARLSEVKLSIGKVRHTFEEY